MSLAYDEYLAEHVGNVNMGLHWMLDNLGLSQEEQTAIEDAMLHEHDASKFSTEEYDAYDKYFYGQNKSYKVVTDFDRAWLHHIHNNPHHWQYWVLMEDDPENNLLRMDLLAGTGEYDAYYKQLPFKLMQIPLDYIFEMIADWWTFSWKAGNLFEIFKWYGEHRDKQYIHPESRKIIERILEKIWDVLIMQETVAGHDISEIEKQYRRFWVEQKADIERSPSEWYKDIGDKLAKQTLEEIEHSDTEDSDEDLYGVPELKKFPMPDKKHVKSAIRFFNYVDPKYEKELAEAILEKAEEFGLSFENDILVGDDNRFKKYLGDDHLAHSGRKGQQWGVRNGPPYPLDQDTVKKEYGKDAKVMESNKSGDGGETSEKKHRESKVSSVKKDLTAQIRELRKEYNALSKKPDTDPELLELVEMEINSLKEEADARQRMAKKNAPDDYYTPVPQSLLDLHPVEKLEDLKKLNENADIKEVRANINHPKGEGGVGRYYNCPNCAAAFELTERGYDVIARPKKTGSNVENIEDFFKDGKLTHAGDDEIHLKKLPDYDKVSKSNPLIRALRQKEFEKEYDAWWDTLSAARKATGDSTMHDLRSQPEGARGIIVVGWMMDTDPDVRTTSYHALNYKVVKADGGGKDVKFFDTQSSWEYKQNGDKGSEFIYGDADPREVYYMRTDNLELSDKITTAVYSNKKG